MNHLDLNICHHWHKDLLHLFNLLMFKKNLYFFFKLIFIHKSWFWQVKPVYGGGHVQRNAFPTEVHWPPLLHGFGAHIPFWSQNCPDQPWLHTHWIDPSLLFTQTPLLPHGPLLRHLFWLFSHNWPENPGKHWQMKPPWTEDDVRHWPPFKHGDGLHTFNYYHYLINY